MQSSSNGHPDLKPAKQMQSIVPYVLGLIVLVLLVGFFLIRLRRNTRNMR